MTRIDVRSARLDTPCVLLRVLGPLEVDGRANGLGRRDRVVLAALAVEPMRGRRPEELAEAVWGDDRPASWTKVVQGIIVRLRRMLGREVVESTAAGYRLVVAEDNLDVVLFERLVERGYRFADVKEPARALVSFEDALRLWRGTAFDELLDWAHKNKRS